MKKLYKFMCVLVITILSMIFSGCGTKFETETAVIIASGRHNNMASFNVANILFSDEDEDMVFLSDKSKIIDIYGIVIDGSPTSVESNQINNLNKSIETVINNKRWDTAQKRLKELNEKMFEVPADDPEVDTLGVFSAAMNHFETLEMDVEKRIIIYDTGVSTEGIIDFAHKEEYTKLLNRNVILKTEEVRSIVDTLKEQKNLPDLDGVMIQWYGIGLVGGKQEVLSNIAIENLKIIWETILKEAGASSVEFKSVDKNKNEIYDETLPLVSIVNLTGTDSVTLDKPISVKKLGFKPFTAEFLDGSEKERCDILSSFVCIGIKEKLLIVGTTSTGGKKGNGLDLSKKRANAVKDELVILGVPEENIMFIGLGINHHMYNEKEFVDGLYMGDSEAAQENRSVYIMQRDSEKAELFLKDYVENLYIR